MRVVVVGVGMMGRICVRQLVERGVEVVGAFGHRHNIGKDAGLVAGLTEPIGIPVRNDMEEALPELRPDVAIVTVGSELAPMAPIFRTCLAAGANVISAAEEPFYPWASSPELSHELDAFARQNNATLFSGGIQDVYWLNEVRVLTGASHTITGIQGFGGSDVENYGPETAHVVRVGLTREEYQRSLETEPLERDYFGTALEAVVTMLGDEVATVEQINEPLFAKAVTPSRALGRNILPGQVLGQVQTTRVVGKSGIRYSTEFRTSVHEPEKNAWHVHGTPELVLENPTIPGPEATCAALINRIPDVLAAPAGLVTADQLPAPCYHVL